MNTVYKTIQNNATITIREQSSRFIGLSYAVLSEDEIKTIISNLRKKYYDATHVCYAYQIGEIEKKYRANDDGEPTNTAGKPIYGQIIARDITNVLVVVVRYFGGTKLGVGGLIKAYKQTAHEVLELAGIKEVQIFKRIEIICEYAQIGFILRELKLKQVVIVKQIQTEKITLDVKIPINNYEFLISFFEVNQIAINYES